MAHTHDTAPPYTGLASPQTGEFESWRATERPDLHAKVQKAKANGMFDATQDPTLWAANDEAYKDFLPSWETRALESEGWRRKRESNLGPGRQDPDTRTPENADPPAPRKKTLQASGVECRRVSWRIGGWVPNHELTMIYGEPSRGKSLVALDMLAHITTGRAWNGRPTGRGRCLIYSAEDRPETTIVPRFRSCGGDDEWLHIIPRTDFDPSCPDDMKQLGQCVKDLGIDVLVLDPIIEVASRARDAHQATQVRNAMKPIINGLVDDLGVTVLGINHTAKGSRDAPAWERQLGSQVWTALPRMTLMCGQDPTPGHEARRIIVRVKSNYTETGGGYPYTIRPADDGMGAYLEWGDRLDGPAETLLAPGRKTTKVDDTITDILTEFEASDSGLFSRADAAKALAVPNSGTFKRAWSTIMSTAEQHGLMYTNGCLAKRPKA